MRVAAGAVITSKAGERAPSPSFSFSLGQQAATRCWARQQPVVVAQPSNNQPPSTVSQFCPERWQRKPKEVRPAPPRQKSHRPPPLPNLLTRADTGRTPLCGSLGSSDRNVKRAQTQAETSTTSEQRKQASTTVRKATEMETPPPRSSTSAAAAADSVLRMSGADADEEKAPVAAAAAGAPQPSPPPVEFLLHVAQQIHRGFHKSLTQVRLVFIYSMCVHLG